MQWGRLDLEKSVRRRVRPELGRSFTAEALEQIEVRTASFIEGDDLAVNDRTFGQFGKGLDDERVVVIEGFAPPRKQAHAAIRFDRDSAVSIELDFVEPTRSVRQLCDGSAVHGLNEVGLSFG